MQYVYVLNKHGEPLMPCSPGKARLLLKQQKARVVKRTPFTIKLLHGSAGYKQPITLGVDAGSKHVGLSASTEKRELYSEEFTPRNDVVELLSTRRQNRRSRRNRKTRYRAPRFNNRSVDDIAVKLLYTAYRNTVIHKLQEYYDYYMENKEENPDFEHLAERCENITNRLAEYNKQN